MKRKYSGKGKVTYKRRKTYKKRTTGKTRVIRQVLKLAETKFRQEFSNGTLRHNCSSAVANPNGSDMVLFGNLLRTDAGTSERQRIGDTIYAKYLKVTIDVASDVDCLKLRFFFVSVPHTDTGATPTNFWANNSGIGLNKNLDSINTDKYKIVKSKEVTLTRQLASTYTRKFMFYVPLNRNITYESEGTNALPKKQRDILSFACIAYKDTGTVAGTVIASYEMKVELTYKDF